MKNSTIDRRVNRTRALLQNALLLLVSEKSYETITVEGICEAANVGRSTFYAHYTGKDDLKRSGIVDHLRQMLSDRQCEVMEGAANPIERRLGFSLAMFKHARDHKEHYRMLAGGRGGAIALRTIRQLLCEFVRSELSSMASNGPAAEVPREVVVHHVVGAYMGLLTWWLDRGATIPPEQMDAMFRRMAMNGLASLDS